MLVLSLLLWNHKARLKLAHHIIEVLKKFQVREEICIR